MSKYKNLQSVHIAVRRFIGDKSGTTAVIFGFALIPLAFAVGTAVDYSRAASTRTSLQSALDAALLAGAVEAAKGTPASTIPNIVNSYFQTNSGLNGAAKLDTQVDTTAGTVAGTAQYALDMAFMKMAGINSLNIGATSEASYSVGLSEVALALDTTGSMSGVKIEAAQKAANDLVDSLFSMPNASQNLCVSLVPFTYYVNVGSNTAMPPGSQVRPTPVQPRSNAGMSIQTRNTATPIR